VLRIAQEALAHGHGLEDAGFACDAEVDVELTGMGDEAHEGFRIEEREAG
jgi:hypothetical protein